MAYSQVQGTFKQRGEESVNNLNKLVDITQDKKVLDLIEVGGSTTYHVGVVTLKDNRYENNVKSYMVTWGQYEFSDFRSEDYLNAYKNFNQNAKSITGAYSNKYDLY